MRNRGKHWRPRQAAAEWGAPTDVAVLDEPSPAVDRAAGRWHRIGVAVALSTVVLVAVVGGTKALVTRPPHAAAQPLTVNGLTVEARMIDLATGCVRDAANYTPDMPAGAWRARLAPCFALTPALLDTLPTPSGAQIAAEPYAAVTHRAADGLTATIVIRLRTSGSPLPVNRYYSVDAGCRPDGTCSLTTLPVQVKNLEGDPL